MKKDIVYNEFLLFAEELVNESGIILKKAFKNKIEYEIKGDQSFITKYDLLIEELFRNRITKKYSNHGILGEEFKSHKTESEFVWVLDPIDGTAQFIAGLPVFGTLIGLAWKGKPLIGIMKYADKDLPDINNGDLVGFTSSGEYEFIIDGEKLYRVLTQFITIKYEYQGNEKEYNPRWAQGS